MQLNIFGTELQSCSKNPLTGFYRDGCCNTGKDDTGSHTICIIATEQFLEFSRMRGNDLSTPQLAFGFSGVKPGDRWCLCALRWKEAYDAGCAPQVVMESTNEKVLDFVPMNALLKHAYKTVTE